jgi:hypothetical protein
MPLGVFRCYACGETCIAEDQPEAKTIHQQTACKGEPVYVLEWEEEEANYRLAPPPASHITMFTIRG